MCTELMVNLSRYHILSFTFSLCNTFEQWMHVPIGTELLGCTSTVSSFLISWFSVYFAITESTNTKPHVSGNIIVLVKLVSPAHCTSLCFLSVETMQVEMYSFQTYLPVTKQKNQSWIKSPVLYSHRCGFFLCKMIESWFFCYWLYTIIKIE